eukprot:5186578-Prymnesium_polylepis.2
MRKGVRHGKCAHGSKERRVHLTERHRERLAAAREQCLLDVPGRVIESGVDTHGPCIVKTHPPLLKLEVASKANHAFIVGVCEHAGTRASQLSLEDKSGRNSDWRVCKEIPDVPAAQDLGQSFKAVAALDGTAHCRLGQSLEAVAPSISSAVLQLPTAGPAGTRGFTAQIDERGMNEAPYSYF